MTKFISLIFCTVFLLFICLPGILMVSKIEPTPINILENRKIPPFPNFSKQHYIKWPKLFEDYFAQNIPLRTHFIATHMRIWEYCLHTPNRYALRSLKSGTLFGLGTILDGTTPLPIEHFYKLRALFAGRQAFFTQHGIKYLLAFAPDKETSRHEELPTFAMSIRPDYIFGRLLPLLKEKNIPVVPTLEALSRFDSKILSNDKHDIYHWSTKGALIASQTISDYIHMLVPQIPILKMDDLIIAEREVSVGPFGKEKIQVLSPTSKQCFKNQTTYWSNICSDSGFLVFTGDSFFQGNNSVRTSAGLVRPEITTVNKYLYKDNADFSYAFMRTLILQENKPDIVVEGHGERSLAYFPQPRNYQYEVNLLGEKAIGTLQCTITPENFAELNIENTKITHSASKLTICNTNASPAIIKINKNVKTDKDGYAVVAAEMLSSINTKVILKYRDKYSATPFQSIPMNVVNNSINKLYYQILTEPNANLEVRLLIQGIGEYTFLPMPYLNELKVN